MGWAELILPPVGYLERQHVLIIAAGTVSIRYEFVSQYIHEYEHRMVVSECKSGIDPLLYFYVDRQLYMSKVSCQKGPTRHAYAWEIGPHWQDTLDVFALRATDTIAHATSCLTSKLFPSPGKYNLITTPACCQDPLLFAMTSHICADHR